MKIDAIKIRSFKSFADTGWVELSDHFTVLVGQNNAGKTAFLQSFNATGFQENRHRSALRPEGAGLSESVVQFRLKVPGSEIERKMLNTRRFDFPTSRSLGSRALSTFLEHTNLYILEMTHGSSLRAPDAPTYKLFQPEEILTHSVWVDVETREIVTQQLFHNSPPLDSIQPTLIKLLQESTFVFSAERYSIGRCTMQSGTTLLPNASNLPYMLLHMNRDHHLMEKFQSLVSEVLPGIKRVLVSTVAEMIELSIQSHSSMRRDLSIPLDECGTGVAQVLAILFVAVSYSAAQIIIDEPNSFLHPSATRRLLNVLRKFERHQFILTTHAADVIATARPEKLLLLQWDEDESQTKIAASSGEDVEHVRKSLRELGCSLTDVFGFDTVVFVEGPTERACFPILAPLGTNSAINFVAMREASALTSAKPNALFDVYTGGVASSALLPPIALFSFDREGRSEKEIEDLVRASKGTARFLPKLMYENFLLHPAAISNLLQNLDGQREETTPAAIERWIAEHFREYGVKKIETTSPETCDAARLLGGMFDELTENRYPYRKVEYGLELTRWLLENDPDYLKELRSYVGDLLHDPGRPPAK